MDGADPDRWSAVAADWLDLWGGLAAPLWQVIAEAAGVGPGTKVVDVGCGSGDLLAYVDALGASTAGMDPAPGMVDFARAQIPRADVRLGSAERLPWPDDAFDLATSVNAVQFAEDAHDALLELARVTKPGGLVAVANWAQPELNDLDTIEEAVAHAADLNPIPAGDLRHPGGLETLFTGCDLDIVVAGVVDTPWSVPDDDTLVRAVLLGEDPSTVKAKAATVIRAARPFRTPSGGYRLSNSFRYAIGTYSPPRVLPTMLPPARGRAEGDV
ncbi:class I SAM-dependent methyltransferase [Solicola gregarius]|uniref:Class I SAM-dependent methyltransferase n=1 Tax=Solicola gregarius TaxID=2908642 RepID=A0AA46YKC7_9ACTN|nr:class I SAM-dependent methyltransferase [Solicola gregarius]UYM05625.1 class I SAM-dependent methyltransferase [Solicola gregarius]